MGLARKRTQTLAYLAGIFDGEGSISIHGDVRHDGRQSGHSGHLLVGMTDPQAVLWFYHEYPEGTLSLRTGTNFPIYCFVLSGNRMFRFLSDMKPYLVIKQRQARLTLAWLAHRRRHHWHHRGRHVVDCNGRCERFMLKLRTMRKEAKGMKSVNLLLKHGLREYRAKRVEVEQLVAHMGRELARLEGVETSGEPSTGNKPISVPEQEIVHAAL